MKIINPWRDGKYFEVDDIVFELGDFRIFKQFDKCYLHAYKDLGFNQLMIPNKELIKAHHKGERPDEYGWIYDRGRKIIEGRFGKLETLTPIEQQGKLF